MFNHTSLAGCYALAYLSAALLCPRIDATRGQKLWVFLPVSPESRTAAALSYGKHLLGECQTLLKVPAMAEIKHPDVSSFSLMETDMLGSSSACSLPLLTF